ncbi:transient receptor potential cation channel subfamily V member 6-like isoform X2 [Convolutriloba macropyga]|uniref:transient receptor potential cation channel subfamily V member 6-like isoform X2 n=1 Tax=Convolutriloba macropyga TaxID=536237 RepID=UPI003F521F54
MVEPLDQELVDDLNRHFSSLSNEEGVEHSADDGQQSRSQIYSLFDLGGRGLLAEKMEESLVKFNMSIVDAAIRDHVTPYLYNNGRGKWIPKNHLVSQRITEIGGRSAIIIANFQHKKISQLMERDQPSQKFSQLDQDCENLLEYQQHRNQQENSKCNLLYEENIDCSGERFCCWDIWRRGSMGETLLHVCLLCGSKIARELAVRLLRIFPMLVVDIYLSNDYYGQTPLHMALLNEDLVLLKMMLDLKDPVSRERVVDLSARCNGSFFIPMDQKQEVNLNPKMGEIPVLNSYCTNYAGPCYWGEFPLSFAVCLGLEAEFTWLLHRGASPLATDLNGNNILHMLVIHNKLDMFKSCIELLEDDILGKLLDTKNKQDYIPLTLAAFCGRKEIFNLILSYQSKVLWIYGDLHAVEYLLTDIDTIRPDGSLNQNSALHIIAMKAKDSVDHMDMLSGVMKELVDWKWSLFGKQILLANFLVYFLFLISYLLGMYLRKPAVASKSSASSSSCYIRNVENNTDYVMSVIEVWTYLQLLLRVVVEVRQFRTLGWKLWANDLILAPTKICFLIGVFVLIPLSLLLRIICQSELEDYACVFTVFCITPHILFYIRSTKCLGPLITVMYRAVSDDLRRFAIMLIVLLTAFSLSSIVIFKSSEDESPFNNFFLTIYLSFCMVMGEVTPSIYDSIKESPYPVFTQFYWVIFFVLSHLLLINVLVAMVYETFHVYKQSHHEWYKEVCQRANLLFIEFDRNRITNNYSFNISYFKNERRHRTRLVVMYEYLLTDNCRKKVLHQYSQSAHRPPQKQLNPLLIPVPGHRPSDTGPQHQNGAGEGNERRDKVNDNNEMKAKMSTKERKVTVKHYFRNGKIVGEILPNGDPRQ